MKVVLMMISAALGALAGALFIHGRLAPEVAVLTGRAESLQMKNKTLQDQVDNLANHTRRLERQLAQAERPAADTSEQPPASQAEAAELLSEDMDAADAFEPQSESPRGPRRRGRPEMGANGQPVAETGQPEEGPGEPEGRQGRMRELEDRMRDRVGSVLQQEYESAPDAESQERIETIQAYMEQMAQLRTAMREAQTDEERDALRQTMWDSSGGMREVLRTQQDSMLRTLASNNGITDTGKQDAFITGLRDLQASPFFQADRMMGGGGRGPGRPEFRMDGGGGGRNPEEGPRQRF